MAESPASSGPREYELRLVFRAADSAQADRLAEAWAGTAAAEWGTRYGGVSPASPGPATDLDALLAELRQHATVGNDGATATELSSWRDVASRAADAVERLTRERDALARDLGIMRDAEIRASDVSHEKARKAEAERDALADAVKRVRDLASEWAGMAPANDGGGSVSGTVLADAGRSVLAALPPSGQR